jgi:hypothetical protein
MAVRLPMSGFLKTWQEKHGQTDEQLATYIGTTVGRLQALATEKVRPAVGSGPVGCSADDIRRIATQHGANFRQLVNVMTSVMNVEPAVRA